MTSAAMVAAPTAGELPALTDSRTTARVRVGWSVQMRWGAEELEGRAADISATGMFVNTTRDLLPGCLVHLGFVAGAATMAAVEAEALVVRRVSPEEARRTGQLPGVGLAFTRFLWGEHGLAAALTDRLDQQVPERIDRRETARFAVSIPVCWSDAAAAGRHTGRLSSLSTSGTFFVETAANALRGKRVHLWFDVPVEGRSQGVRAVGRVVRASLATKAPDGSQPVGMAIALEQCGVDERTLASFLDRRVRTVTLIDTAEGSHPTDIEDLFLAAVAEWEEKGIAAAGGVAAEVETRIASTIPAGAPRATTPPRTPSRPDRSPTVDWLRVATATAKLSGGVAVALLGLLLGVLLRLI